MIDEQIDYKAREHQWAEALREPQRRQCSETLGETDRFGRIKSQCCLDVACELAGVPWEEADGNVRRVDPLGGSSKLVLPPTAKLWLGLGAEDPRFDIPAQFLRSQGCKRSCDVHEDRVDCRIADSLAGCDTATHLNDSWGLTFPQIADMIDYFGLVRP